MAPLAVPIWPRALAPCPVEPFPPTTIAPRQAGTTTAIIPTSYGAMDSSPSPGVVAGITLGSVAGFLLILYLIYFCINMGNPQPENAESSVTGSVVMERRRMHTHRHHRHRSRGSATVEVKRTSRVVPGRVIVEEEMRGGGGGERIIVEDVRRRSMSRGGRGPPPMRVVHSDDDEVVVIEEHSPERRRRRSRVRSVERRSGGYERRDSSSRRGSSSMAS